MPLTFNGINSSFYGTASAVIPTNGQWSMMWWMRQTGMILNLLGPIYCAGEIGENMSLWKDDDVGIMSIQKKYGGAIRAKFVDGPVLNRWTCDCFAWDSSNSTNNPTWYRRDAGLETSLRELTVTDSGAASGTEDAESSTFTIGGDIAYFSYAFNGQLAHIQMWSRMLTLSEFTQAMHWPGSVTNGLTQYWPMWNGGESIRDNSANATLRSVSQHRTSAPPVSQYGSRFKQAGMTFVSA